MNLNPPFDISGILCAIATFVVAGLSAYVLALAIVFLRLWIAELRRPTPATRIPLSC